MAGTVGWGQTEGLKVHAKVLGYVWWGLLWTCRFSWGGRRLHLRFPAILSFPAALLFGLQGLQNGMSGFESSRRKRLS